MMNLQLIFATAVENSVRVISSLLVSQLVLLYSRNDTLNHRESQNLRQQCVVHEKMKKRTVRTPTWHDSSPDWSSPFSASFHRLGPLIHLLDQ